MTSDADLTRLAVAVRLWREVLARGSLNVVLSQDRRESLLDLVEFAELSLVDSGKQLGSRGLELARKRGILKRFFDRVRQWRK